MLNDSSTKVLQAPQIRAVDNQKATLKIGEKVPTASGSFQPGVAGVGVSPLVNTQFTYLDVGVNMEMLPKVHENNEVSMHIDLDISQVDSYQNLGGISEPEIGQNKETADVRLREGEINLIGGIIQQTDTRSTTGIPGLANIPVLGRLFKGENIENDRNELVIALMPHIVRGPDITESNLRGVAAGNATQIKVGYGAHGGCLAEKVAAIARRGARSAGNGASGGTARNGAGGRARGSSRGSSRWRAADQFRSADRRYATQFGDHGDDSRRQCHRHEHCGGAGALRSADSAHQQYRGGRSAAAGYRAGRAHGAFEKHTERQRPGGHVNEPGPCCGRNFRRRRLVYSGISGGRARHYQCLAVLHFAIKPERAGHRRGAAAAPRGQCEVTVWRPGM